MKRTRKKRTKYVNMTGLLILLLLGVIGFSFLLGLSLSQDTPSERQQMRIAEQRAVMPWRITSRTVTYAAFGIFAKVALVVMACYVVFYLIAIARNWLDLRARLIRPQSGIFPLVRANDGQLYDPNRAAGENPYITLAALQVQNTAALPQPEKMMIRTATQKAIKPPTTDMPDIEEIPLPKRINFRQLHNGQSSIHNLLLGVKAEAEQIVPVYESLYNLVHVGIGGSSGFGKSLFLQALAYQLLTAHEKVSLVMCDLEAVTLLPFANNNRLLYPLATQQDEIAYVLQQVSDNELNKRKELFSQHRGCASLAQYNAIAQDNLPPIACMIDEATMLGEDDNVRMALQNLALRGRKYGLFLIAASQDWKHDTFNTKFTNQFSSRFQFGCRNKAQSRVLMGEAGAETFNDPGRCMAQLKGHPTMIMQAPYLENGMLETLPQGPPQNVIDLDALVPMQSQEANAQRIQELNAQGLSMNAIQQEVFGYTGGKAYSEVKRILG
jgi:hypothetical protein